MRRRFSWKFTMLCSMLASSAVAQDSIRSRTILIGDAGEINKVQDAVIKHAAGNILPGKTSVIYLGDNIYSHGMGLPGDPGEVYSKDVVRSQYKPMREKGAPVYFIPGNHDWDRMGPKGLEKIKLQWQFLEDQQDSLLKLLPPDGCPDPIAVRISETVTVILYDSEWWLFPFEKKNMEAECGCATKKDVLIRLEELIYENRNSFIILAGHHPFSSYGVHGGHYSWKDHIFPLRAANKKLYIPLPVVGSLYPTLRRLFSNPEDLGHPLYKEMARDIKSVFKGFPNWVYVSGHDHGLQFIREPGFVQIVSGGGSRNDYVKKGNHALYTHGSEGYVIADQLPDNSIRFTYFVLSDSGVHQTFSVVQPFTPVTGKEKSLVAVELGDSTALRLHPAYDSVSKFHRKLFGENYRKEYAALTTFPVLKMSAIKGGLTPTQRGGGMQSKSLRLEDKDGNEYALRSVMKSSDALLPAELKQTFARDWVDDAMSAQHPYSALMVPPIATAVKIPHAKPVIGYVAPDTMLGVHNYTFANTVALLEERNPLGKSDNTLKMLANLNKDNDNSYDPEMYLKSQMIDLLVGDWDRHEDQWRWKNISKNKDKFYVPIPRDRDQVLHKTEGFFPKMASRQWLLPTLQGFGPKIKSVKYSLFKTKFMNAFPAGYISEEKWKAVVQEFTTAVTDSVLDAAVKQLPASSYAIRGQELLSSLKSRRDAIPAAMRSYYKFTSKIVDVKLSNKNESVYIQQGADASLLVTVRKINKEGILKDTLMHHNFAPALTREIRLFLAEGNDSVRVNYTNTPIKLKIVGGKGAKVVETVAVDNKPRWYGLDTGTVFSGNTALLRKHLSPDSTNTAFVPTNLYNVWMPKTTIGINLDDGFLLGFGFQYTHNSGFRKLPYTYRQELVAGHSFSTNAFRIRYMGEWIEAFGKADFTLTASARAPNNTINFFGLGNETPFNKTDGYKRFYRTRFSLYQLDPAVRWDNRNGISLTAGPSLQYYRMEASDTIGRFINTGKVSSYDSTTITESKLHAGLAVHLSIDKRNQQILTSWGYQINLRLNAYQGVNKFAKEYMQISPEVILYKTLSPRGNVVLTDRLGGMMTFGHPAFYQSAFVGGQGNLLGYRQYRFAGNHSMFNNLELRIKLADVANYILPGQLGISGFHDIGRVWTKDDNSKKWHNGFGGGVYFSPASIAVFSLVMGKSNEGWYPYFSMGMRF